MGVLPLTSDVLADIRNTCAHIQELRRMLIRALGLTTRDEA